jgi:hypothetical protein
MKLLATLQALEAARRYVDPMRLTLAALREAVALQVANRTPTDSEGRYQAIVSAPQMAELREDPAFATALASGEVEIVDRPAAKRPTWMRWAKPVRPSKPRNTILALRPCA